MVQYLCSLPKSTKKERLVARKIFELEIIPIRDDWARWVKELTSLWITCAFIVLVMIFAFLLFRLDPVHSDDVTTVASTMKPATTVPLTTTKITTPTTIKEVLIPESTTDVPVAVHCNATHCVRDCCTMERLTCRVVCQGCPDQGAASTHLGYLQRVTVKIKAPLISINNFFFRHQDCKQWDLEFDGCRFNRNTVGPSWLAIDQPIASLRFHFKSHLLERIEKNAFQAEIFQATESLDFDNVLIKKINSDTFEGLPSLRNLRVASTILTEVTKDAFVHSVNLTRLAIKGGWKLKTTKITAGKQYSKVEEINYTGTQYIAKIEKKSFESVPKLRAINFARTNLKTIESGAFKGADELLQVNVSGNSLTTLPSGVLNDIAKRRGAIIDLTENPWLCNCALVELQRLLSDESTRGAFVDIDNIRCIKLVFPKWVYGSSVVSSRICG